MKKLILALVVFFGSVSATKVSWERRGSTERERSTLTLSFEEEDHTPSLKKIILLYQEYSSGAYCTFADTWNDVEVDQEEIAEITSEITVRLQEADSHGIEMFEVAGNYLNQRESRPIYNCVRRLLRWIE